MNGELTPIAQDALDFLSRQMVGHDDSAVICIGHILKSAGAPFSDWDGWAAASGCTCRDRQNRWDSFAGKDRDPSSLLIGYAIKHHGYQRPVGAARSVNGRPPPATTVEAACYGCGQLGVYLRHGLCLECRPDAPQNAPPPKPPALPIAAPPPPPEPDTVICVTCGDEVHRRQTKADGNCLICAALAAMHQPPAPAQAPPPQPAPAVREVVAAIGTWSSGCVSCGDDLFPSEIAIWKLAHNPETERQHCYACARQCDACRAVTIPRGMPIPPPKPGPKAAGAVSLDRKGYGSHAGRRQLEQTR